VRILIALTVFAFVAVASSSSQEVKKKDVKEEVKEKDAKKKAFVYPMATGMKWTYNLVGKNIEMINEIVGEDTVGDRKGFNVSTKVNGAEVARETIQIDKGKAFRLSLNGNAIEPPVEFFRIEAADNEKWEGEFTLMGSKASSTFATTIEDLEVPFGKIKGAKKVVAEAKDGTNTVISTFWFADGVGMVKQKIVLNGAEVVDVELKSFDKAKS
jgi:hypothetical protein